MREYKRLADQMVALDPNNMRWRVEQQSADSNLGIMLLEGRKFREAVDQLTRALASIEALSTADPNNTDYHVAATELQGWLADARMYEGQLGEAVAIRRRLVGQLQDLLEQTGDVVYRQKLVVAERELGELYESRGELQEALPHFRAAVEHSGLLVAREPTNFRWKYFSARTRLSLADSLLASGQRQEAAREAVAGCGTTAQLLATDARVQDWRANLRECWKMRSRLSLASGDFGQAARFAERAVDIAKTIRTTDPIEDRYALAQSYRLLGDARRQLGDKSDAQVAWSTGLAAIPANVTEKPNEMAERAVLLKRLGRMGEARALYNRLIAMGYQQDESRS